MESCQRSGVACYPTRLGLWGGDYECEPYLALQGDGLDCEVQSLSFLSPNNDLRTNLALLYPTTAQPGMPPRLRRWMRSTSIS